MTNSAFSIIQFTFSTIWRLFTSWRIPGTIVTPASLIFFVLSAGLAIKFIVNLMGSHVVDTPNVIETESVNTSYNPQTGKSRTIFNKSRSVSRKK